MVVPWSLSTRLGHRTLSAGFRLGPAPRRALGPAAIPAAPTGRTRDRTRPMLQAVRKFLPGRRPHVTQSGPLDVRCLHLVKVKAAYHTGLVSREEHTGAAAAARR